MIKIGQYNLLKVKSVEFAGAILVDKQENEVFIPKKNYSVLEPGQTVKVFIFNDHEGKSTATTKEPYGLVNEFAYLRVVENNNFGTFVDLGIERDLYIPISEQHALLYENYHYWVYIYLDPISNRLAGSTKVNKYLLPCSDELEEGREVAVKILEDSEMGLKVIVNNRFSGLIFHNELFKNLQEGDQTKGFVKKIREDGKLDISLQKQGYLAVIPDMNDTLLNALHNNKGFLALTDNSAPEEIYSELGISKKNFKKSVGNLFKKKIITIEKTGIRLNHFSPMD